MLVSMLIILSKILKLKWEIYTQKTWMILMLKWIKFYQKEKMNHTSAFWMRDFLDRTAINPTPTFLTTTLDWSVTHMFQENSQIVISKVWSMKSTLHLSVSMEIKCMLLTLNPISNTMIKVTQQNASLASVIVFTLKFIIRSIPTEWPSEPNSTMITNIFQPPNRKKKESTKSSARTLKMTSTNALENFWYANCSYSLKCTVRT